ncbi:MAG: hypothetical protein DLM73_05800 [Chthoniobacterales bacterium]|nr:MAG: hypothetical protein DLM73_05800 [Chthoniobacterales bacterium]
MGVGHKSFVLVCALALAACTRKAAPSLFENNGATAAVQQITARLHPPVRVLKIAITPSSLSMLVQDPAAPTHVNEYRYSQVDLGFYQPTSVSGPEAVQPHLINPKLEENLFNLEGVDLAAVPGAVKEAIKQTALEGGGAVERIEIKRTVGILPRPENGDVEWMIAVRSPRETASAYADARGNVDRLDLSGTERAKNVNFTEGGTLLDQVLGRIRKTFGGNKPVFLKMSLERNRVWFQVRATEPPYKVKKQICDLNGLHGDVLGDLQEEMQPSLTELRDKMEHKGPVTEAQCFSLDEINWSKLPEMRKGAIQQMGGTVEIGEINLRRRVGYASPLAVEWEFITRRRFEEGFVQYDMKGKPLRFQLPLRPTLLPNQLEPENARVILNAIRDDFGPQTRLIGIELRKDQAWVTASPPGHPEKGWEYGYSLRDGMKVWSDTGVSRPDNDTQMINVEEVLKMVDALNDLKQKALAQATEGEIERVNFYRYRPRAQSKLLLIEFTVSKGIANTVGVTYDSTGRLVR